MCKMQPSGLALPPALGDVSRGESGILEVKTNGTERVCVCARLLQRENE